mmetsp:Transcript_52226/g.58355  ORF Transcript_52226/g.58355 Transcript_52226/m.58355 type:complete len:102 (+) Transcript_52226:382-687(+)
MLLTMMMVSFFKPFGRNNNATKNLVAMNSIVFVVVKFGGNDLGYLVWLVVMIPVLIPDLFISWYLGWVFCMNNMIYIYICLVRWKIFRLIWCNNGKQPRFL